MAATQHVCRLVAEAGLAGQWDDVAHTAAAVAGMPSSRGGAGEEWGLFEETVRLCCGAVLNSRHGV